jgi:hypothetical protein
MPNHICRRIDNTEKPASSFTMQFYKLAIGARFEYEGKQHLKTGMDVNNA